MTFEIVSVNISQEKGTLKHPVAEITLIPEHGIKGDAHAGPGHRQVSFLASEAINRMKAKGLQVSSGSFGENIVTCGINWAEAKVGARVLIGETELEVTQIGKECTTPCAIYYQAGECIMPAEGAFAKVLKGGTIRAEDRGDYNI